MRGFVHPPDLLTVLSERLVHPDVTAHVMARPFFPAEQLRIEADRAVQVAGGKLVPGIASGCCATGAGPVGRCGSWRVQSEGGALRVGDHGVTADVGDVRCALENLAPETLDILDRRIDARSTDINQPVRLRSRALRFRRQRHHSARLGLTRIPQRVAGHARGLGLPRHHFRVEGAGGIRIRRHQLVPHEASPNIRVAHGETSPFFRPCWRGTAEDRRQHSAPPRIRLP